MGAKLYFRCSGDDPAARAAPKLFACPDSGTEVEIWTDELKGKCTSCSRVLQKNKIIEIEDCLLRL